VLCEEYGIGVTGWGEYVVCSMTNGCCYNERTTSGYMQRVVSRVKRGGQRKDTCIDYQWQKLESTEHSKYYLSIPSIHNTQCQISEQE
jgi:hypothetical protein